MPRVHLPAALFALLFSCVVASAQHSDGLVVKDDAGDPCRRFKLRILVPSPDIDPQSEVNKRDANIDYTMRVTNPCARQAPQVAILVPELLPPGGGRGFFVPPQFKAERAAREKGGEPALWAPQGARRPSVMELMRGRK